jgi:hypothetical protein
VGEHLDYYNEALTFCQLYGLFLDHRDLFSFNLGARLLIFDRLIHRDAISVTKQTLTRAFTLVLGHWECFLLNDTKNFVFKPWLLFSEIKI